jgi:hypothetical protein
MNLPSPVATWPSLAELPALYPDARNRDNRGPFLYRAGKTWPLRLQPDTARRIPLLAVGSNGYPRQLHDKLAGSPEDLQGIPLLPAILRDFDVAYCPIRSRKGYIPVTLASRPGAVCLTWLQWLTPEQLNVISATEGARYSLVGGPSLAARTEIQPRLQRPRSIYAWWFDSVLEHDGSTVWLDVYRRPGGTNVDLSGARPNVVPEDWRVVPRTPGSLQIRQESMSEWC